MGKERYTDLEKSGANIDSTSMDRWNRQRQIYSGNIRPSHTGTGARYGKTKGLRCVVCGSNNHQTLKGTCPKRRHQPLRNLIAFGMNGKNDILSNFYICSLKVFHRIFKSVEHAYQYMKAVYYDRTELAEEICRQPTAWGAKNLAKQVLTEDSWHENKLDIMRDIIRAKAACVPEFRMELLKSQDKIVETVQGDYFWSCGLRKHEVFWTNEKDWPGKNVMGQLLMELRTELQNKESSKKQAYDISSVWE